MNTLCLSDRPTDQHRLKKELLAAELPRLLPMVLVPFILGWTLEGLVHWVAGRWADPHGYTFMMTTSFAMVVWVAAMARHAWRSFQLSRFKPNDDVALSERDLEMVLLYAGYRGGRELLKSLCVAHRWTLKYSTVEKVIKELKTLSADFDREELHASRMEVIALQRQVSRLKHEIAMAQITGKWRKNPRPDS